MIESLKQLKFCYEQNKTKKRNHRAQIITQNSAMINRKWM